ncbi:MAG: hypothetical protein H7336_04710 [Bacteriovorax sp.]|nr:hypothetical protein [Bacteriovorax sp.]
MIISESKPEQPNLKNQKGQTFLEFIFVLMLLVTISFGFMKGFSRLVGSRWEIMLQIIAKPNQDSVRLP